MVKEIKKVTLDQNAANMEMLDKIAGMEEREAERLAYKEGKKRIAEAKSLPGYIKLKASRKEQEKLARDFAKLIVSEAKEKNLLAGQIKAPKKVPFWLDVIAGAAAVFMVIKTFILFEITQGRRMFLIRLLSFGMEGQQPSSFFIFLLGTEQRNIPDNLQPGKYQQFYRYRLFINMLFIISIEMPLSKWISHNRGIGTILHNHIAEKEPLHPKTGRTLEGYTISIGPWKVLWK